MPRWQPNRRKRRPRKDRFLAETASAVHAIASSRDAALAEYAKSIRLDTARGALDREPAGPHKPHLLR